MLLNLHVKNIALIDDVNIDFGEGLNILTGETGAGKSIIIDAVNFALGARMPKDIVREDTKQALCELVFSVEDETVKKALVDMDIDVDDEQVILSRKIINGKSSLKCNGESITTSIAKEIAELLIDIHGQHEHQSLLYKSNHRKILDEYCGLELQNIMKEYKPLYREYKEKTAELEEALSQGGSKDSDVDYCNFVVNEIENARLVTGEDDELEEQFSRMNNLRKIAESIQAVREYIMNDEAGAASLVSRATSYLKQASGYDREAEDLEQQLLEIDGLLGDFGRNLLGYEESLVFSPEEFAVCEERLNEINRLKMKYAPTIEGILKYLEAEQKKLEKLADFDSYIDSLKEEVAIIHGKVTNMCKNISELRAKEAVILAEEIRKSLSDLNFLDAKFEISIVSDDTHISENGYDDVEFLISTNPGEAIRPLTQVASGGELSRIMLALKAVFAGKDSIGTLIFDEIDTGISGRTAQLVADKMSCIAKCHQVICVTHLPQIASHADTHFLIEKSASNDHTVTNVTMLDFEDSVRELARMLSGAEITEATLANAREMKIR